MAPPADARLRLETVRLTALFGRRAVLKDVTIIFPARTVTAVIGPSGCGKSTFLRCLNRMHELSEGGWVTGRVLLDGADIYDSHVDPVQLRRRIGMVFQRPTPFPTMSIYDNVAAGLRVNGHRGRRELDEVVERALRQAALWDEVKDRLRASALALSGASSSASASPARSRPSRRCCCWTSPLRRSTPPARSVSRSCAMSSSGCTLS